MFWTERDKENPSVMKATMDGRNLTSVRSEGVLRPSGITVDYRGKRICWADTLKLVLQCTDFDGINNEEFSILHRNFLPDYVGIHEGTLYWAGKAGGSGDEAGIFRLGIATKEFYTESGEILTETLTGNVMGLKGFALYHTGMVTDSSRRNPCEAHSCSGLCLLSGPSNFSCVCPEGFFSVYDNDWNKCVGECDILLNSFH